MARRRKASRGLERYSVKQLMQAIQQKNMVQIRVLQAKRRELLSQVAAVDQEIARQGGAGLKRAAAKAKRISRAPKSPKSAAAPRRKAVRMTRKIRARLAARIQALLRNAPEGLGIRQIGESVRKPASRLRAVMGEMVSAKQVRKEGDKRGTRYCGV